MKRRDSLPTTGLSKPKGLIATRISQHQQKKTPIPTTRSHLPRSYSTPASQNDTNDPKTDRGYVMRCFSTPESKTNDFRRNSDSFYRPNIHGSRSELDKDLENFENFEESFLDIDDEQDLISFTAFEKSPEREDEPKKVVASLLPGIGLRRISLKPITSKVTPTSQSNREYAKDLHVNNKSKKGANRPILQPLVLKMPAHQLRLTEPPSPKFEDLECPPRINLETADLEMEEAERLLNKEIAMAVAENDSDTVRSEECLLKPDPNSSRQVRRRAQRVQGFDEDDSNSLRSLRGQRNGSVQDLDLSILMDNLKKKSQMSRQNQALNTQVTSSSSQQMVSSSSSSTAATSQRVQTSSQRLSQMAASEMKASSMKSGLSELKSSISEMKNLSSLNFGQRLRSSMENIVDQEDLSERHLPDIRDLSEMSDIGECDIGELGGENPLVTFPESETPPPISDKPLLSASAGTVGSSSANEVKYSAARVTTSSSTKVVTDGYSASTSAANSARMTRLKRGDLQFAEQSAAGASHRLLQAEGLTAEQNAAYLQEQRSLKAGEVTAQEANNMSSSSSRLQTEAVSAEKKAMASAQSRQMVTSTGMFSHKEHSSVAHSNMTISSKNVSTKSKLLSSQMNQMINGIANMSTFSEEELRNLSLEDLILLHVNSDQEEVEKVIRKYSSKINFFIAAIKNNQVDVNNQPQLLKKINEILRKAWAVPIHELGYSLCNTLRTSGGLDILMKNCSDVARPELQYYSAMLLEQCLTNENREYVINNGLEKLVQAVVANINRPYSEDLARRATGILEHLFKHDEGTCSVIVRLGGLDAILFECRRNDVETLTHCAMALANLSLYGGLENHDAMIKRKVPMWLFPLAFHQDDNIKYYACLAISVLVANKEIEAAVKKSGTLELVEPFITTHEPSEFARSNLSHAHGQSKTWLKRLVPILSSKREEARNLAAFHFCMEAGIKQKQGNTEIFKEIGAVDALKKVASCPNAVASKYAAQALRLIGEDLPHKLSQQVPLWSVEDVREWVKQIGFVDYATNFYESRVDGDLLLQLSEDNLIEDIGLRNGIKRKRFTRELQQLKRMADYSSKDTGSLIDFLQRIGPEYTIYTYSMLNAGVNRESIRGLSDEQLEKECNILNSIHRIQILNAIRAYECNLMSKGDLNTEKNLDVFVSYRRSNGSQLASLLKVHLELRGFTVFIDVERLEAGKFDNNLLQSIRQAKNFLLVLTPCALDRCKHDADQKDWVHREIVAALQSHCNIVPIIDTNFEWPEPEELPDDMRAICHFNGVRWIHDYQDACVEKLENFLRGKSNLSSRPEVSLRGRVNEVQNPGSASIGRGPPSYQRVPSCEGQSASVFIGAPASDKD